MADPAPRFAPPRTRRRRFVTPEGVDLQLELGSGATRASAFLLDLLLLLLILIAGTVALAYLLSRNTAQWVLILWMLGAFVLRNGWFILFEMSGRGATPGKRITGLRVVARDGARLTGGAVVARNAMREIEVFLPLSFLGYLVSQEAADAFLAIFALAWSGTFLFFPLFNRDRLRLGDMIAGTWVVQAAGSKLGDDLAMPLERPRRVFGEAALALYGEYELQTLEQVLRDRQAEAVATVAATIRRKAALPDDGDDYGFLTDYYVALCGRLERRLVLGQRRADKFADA